MTKRFLENLMRHRPVRIRLIDSRDPGGGIRLDTNDGEIRERLEKACPHPPSAVDLTIDMVDVAMVRWENGRRVRRCDGETEAVSGRPCLCDPDKPDCRPEVWLRGTLDLDDGPPIKAEAVIGGWTAARAAEDLVREGATIRLHAIGSPGEWASLGISVPTEDPPDLTTVDVEDLRRELVDMVGEEAAGRILDTWIEGDETTIPVPLAETIRAVAASAAG